MAITMNSELKRQYKENLPPMGIYQIRNLVTGKVFIGRAQNLPGIINSQRFQLKMGAHKNSALQSDWKKYGEDQFAFEVLDELNRNGQPEQDYLKELALLEDMWLDKLKPYGETGYNRQARDLQQ
jgi:hypothetical protein